MAGEQPDLAAKVGAALQGLLPSLTQAIVEQINAEAGTDADDGGNGDHDPGDNTPRSMEQPLAPNPDAGNLGGPGGNAPSAPNGGNDEDPAAKKYRAMETQCYEAYQAGRASATKYSRTAGESDLHRVVARQQVKLQELSDQIVRERRDITRYSKLHERATEFTFETKRSRRNGAALLVL